MFKKWRHKYGWGENSLSIKFLCAPNTLTWCVQNSLDYSINSIRIGRLWSVSVFIEMLCWWIKNYAFSFRSIPRILNVGTPRRSLNCNHKIVCDFYARIFRDAQSLPQFIFITIFFFLVFICFNLHIDKRSKRCGWWLTSILTNGSG